MVYDQNFTIVASEINTIGLSIFQRARQRWAQEYLNHRLEAEPDATQRSRPTAIRTQNLRGKKTESKC